MIAVDIAVCTFRRPHLAATLHSLAGLAVPEGYTVRIIVADNDDTPSARDLVGTEITYLHAPARNISIARNACLAAATAPLLAFIDDDELANPDWLVELLAEMDKTGADAVLGPVLATYSEGVPTWLARGDFHSTYPVWVDREIVTGYSCNVLFRRTAPVFEGLRFDVALGRSGGEDTVFFAEAYRRGARLGYAPGAIVTEPVTPARTSFGWLLKRRFRSGQTHALLNSGSRGKLFVKAAGKAGFCYGMAALCGWRPDRARYWLLRGTVHLGVISRLLGKSGIEQYG